MKNKWIKVMAMLGSMLLVTGCWDSVELNERHIVLDMAIDKSSKEAPGEMPGEPEYKVTYCIPDIAKLSGKDSLSEDVKTVLSVDSPTLAQSVSDIETKTQDTISFSHTKAILLGSELMKDRQLFKRAIDSLNENTEISQGTYLLAVNGDAGKIDEAGSYQNPVVGLYIMKYFSNAERGVGDYEKQSLGNFRKELQETGISMLPIITANEKESTLEISGAAIIKDYELKGWVGQEEVRAKQLVEGKVKGETINGQIGDLYFTYEVKEEKCRIGYGQKDSQLVINFNVDVKGELVEYNPGIVGTESEDAVLEKVKQYINEKLKQEIETGLGQTKKINVDFMHIEEKLYQHNPKLWKSYKKIWDNNELKLIQTNVAVHSTIQRMGGMQ